MMLSNPVLYQGRFGEKEVRKKGGRGAGRQAASMKRKREPGYWIISVGIHD